jgi:hypothetical protein
MGGRAAFRCNVAFLAVTWFSQVATQVHKTRADQATTDIQRAPGRLPGARRDHIRNFAASNNHRDFLPGRRTATADKGEAG